MLYLWIKALHLISLIFWMAGMLYLPRLFVYHCNATPGGESDVMLKTMERKLLRYIMTPALLFTWLFGLWLVTLLGEEYIKTAGWLHIKIVFVLLMTGAHGFLASSRRKFAAGTNKRSARFWRIFNEVPAVMIVIIVLLAVTKPF